jgi:hypothetical protein
MSEFTDLLGRMRGGQYLLRQMGPTLEKLDNNDKALLHKAIKAAHDDGKEEGLSHAKSRIRQGRFLPDGRIL